MVTVKILPLKQLKSSNLCFACSQLLMEIICDLTLYSFGCDSWFVVVFLSFFSENVVLKEKHFNQRILGSHLTFVDPFDIHVYFLCQTKMTTGHTHVVIFVHLESPLSLKCLMLASWGGHVVKNSLLDKRTLHQALRKGDTRVWDELNRASRHLKVG